MPYRDEAVDVFLTIAKYCQNEDYINATFRFFEQLIPYLYPPEEQRGFREWDFDNFRFIVHELFLYLMTALLKYERFAQASTFLDRKYFAPHRYEEAEDLTSFLVFRKYLKSLEHRNNRLGLRSLSLRANLLKERCTIKQVSFIDLCRLTLCFFSGDF